MSTWRRIAITFFFLVYHSTSSAEIPSNAERIVSCINIENGHPIPYESYWRPTLTELVLLQGSEVLRVKDGFYPIRGIPKIFHGGSWLAWLDLTTDNWVAFQTLNNKDWPEIPQGVVKALMSCNVEWTGSLPSEIWSNEISVPKKTKPPAIPWHPNPSLNGSDLLPP